MTWVWFLQVAFSSSFLLLLLLLLSFFFFSVFSLVISNPEVKRTLATLRKAEFGFLGELYMRFSPHTAPRSILSKSLDPFLVRESPPFFHSASKSN
ncbi:hypothetical protein RGQ29_028343 [Quercus rubra]|uniref:Uncharacterized protein n=1 Tax=Quercus rubra TaxID=3512 RepID=A0AAN7ERW9_QUERU|nr:hypothetical protein RGQ29_028343 [Quercus rubra]